MLCLLHPVAALTTLVLIVGQADEVLLLGLRTRNHVGVEVYRQVLQPALAANKARVIVSWDRPLWLTGKLTQVKVHQIVVLACDHSQSFLSFSAARAGLELGGVCVLLGGLALAFGGLADQIRTLHSGKACSYLALLWGVKAVNYGHSSPRRATILSGPSRLR